MTELAKLLIEDGQPERAISNYLSSTFEDIEGVEGVNYYSPNTTILDESGFIDSLRSSVELTDSLIRTRVE